MALSAETSQRTR